VTAPDVLVALTPVIEILEQLGVRYLISGSVASSIHGIARSTLDIDLVADLADEHVGPLASALADSYYIEESTVRDAVRRQTSFNVIHLDTMLKIDLFVLRADRYERKALERGRDLRLEKGREGRCFRVGSPEDVILHKLAGYRSGGEVSDRHWRDVIGIIEVQGESLAGTYLRRWAAHLDVDDLVERALSASGR